MLDDIRHRDAAPNCDKCRHVGWKGPWRACSIVVERDGGDTFTDQARRAGAPCGPEGELFEPVTKSPNQGFFRCMFRGLRWCR